MKNGTLYAKRVKKFFTKLKSVYGKPDPPPPTNPIDQLIVGLLAADAPESKAIRAAKTLRDSMVDVNDLRVSTSGEVAAVIAPHIPNGEARADAIRNALNAIFRKENAVTLDRLPKMGRREAKQYLEQLHGVDAFATASVILWSLGGHAIPVDRAMHAVLRREELVEASASITEVQAFLERNVAAADARMFCMLMQQVVQRGAPRTPAYRGPKPTATKKTKRSTSRAKKSAAPSKRVSKSSKRASSR